MSDKIFEPFFISNHTIISFDYCKQDQKLVSLKDIIQEFSKLAQTHAKYFFTFRGESKELNTLDDLIAEVQTPVNG